MKTLNDYPEFKVVADRVRALENERQTNDQRKATIQSESANASPAARVAFFSGWQDEFVQLERCEPLLLEQIEEAKGKREWVRGQVSLPICMEVRPAFIKQVKRTLHALKELSAANAELDRMRYELEEAGVNTGSIPHCNFLMDRWGDERGGLVTGFQRWIREHFPELKDETY
jgi:hypothetical protein